MITHGNLLHNSARDPRQLRFDAGSRGVFWLPLFHDMGLIGGVIQTLYCGGSSTLFSPVSFLQRPMRWLQAISRTGGDDQRRAELRLRSLRREDDARAARRAGPELAGAWRSTAPSRSARRRSTASPKRSPRPGSAGRRSFPATGWPRRRCSSRAARRAARPSSLSVDADGPRSRRDRRGRARPRAAKRLAGSGQVAAGHRVVVVDPATGMPLRRGSRRRDLGLGPERRTRLLGATRGDARTSRATGSAAAKGRSSGRATWASSRMASSSSPAGSRT